MLWGDNDERGRALRVSFLFSRKNPAVGYSFLTWLEENAKSYNLFQKGIKPFQIFQTNSELKNEI